MANNEEAQIDVRPFETLEDATRHFMERGFYLVETQITSVRTMRKGHPAVAALYVSIWQDGDKFFAEEY